MISAMPGKLIAVSELPDAPAITRAWRGESKPMMRMPVAEVPQRPVGSERFAELPQIIDVEPEMRVVPLRLWTCFRRKKDHGLVCHRPKRSPPVSTVQADVSAAIARSSDSQIVSDLAADKAPSRGRGRRSEERCCAGSGHAAAPWRGNVQESSGLNACMNILSHGGKTAAFQSAEWAAAASSARAASREQ